MVSRRGRKANGKGDDYPMSMKELIWNKNNKVVIYEAKNETLTNVLSLISSRTCARSCAACMERVRGVGGLSGVGGVGE